MAKTKNNFEKEFCKLMNNLMFGKPRENIARHQKFKLLSNDKRRHVAVFERNHRSANGSLENH